MIKVQRQACLAVSVLFFQTSIGCLSTNSPQLERCQTEKKQLLSRLVDEQKRGESLTTELRTANQRLADAEKQLARVVGGSGAGRLASVTELGNTGAGGSNGLAGGPTGGATIGATVGGMGSGMGGAMGGSTTGANSGGLRPLQLGAPRDSQFVSAMPNNSGAGLSSGTTRGTARGAADSATGGSASNTAGSVGGSRPATVDARGFDQLAPRNGRSESGWMPRSSGTAAGASAAGSMGSATDGSSR